MSTPREELVRGRICHTPRNPFQHEDGLVCLWDGGMLIRDGRIAGIGEYAEMRAAHPEAAGTDLRAGFILPGLVDTHVHFPQLRVLGGLGRTLLDWLEQCALPEEALMRDPAHACRIAKGFLRAAASHGTTTALVFGAHFASATAALFEAGRASGLRIVSGLVVSDRMLLPSLHTTPERAYRESVELIRRFHGRGRLLYAVTPRFALSASEAVLEVCQTLLEEFDGLRFQTHLNENEAEIAAIPELFPWASDYLAVYEKFGLAGPRAVMAHNVHPTDSELARLAGSGTFVSHCPCSNAALGSGIFPMRRHLKAGARFALGTDVGGGTGFGMLKEGLQSYMLQRVAGEGLSLNVAQLLYLATRAGAEAVGLEDEIGDFQVGKAADFVYWSPVAGSPLAAALERADDPRQALAALFTLAGSESVREVRVSGAPVYPA